MEIRPLLSPATRYFLKLIIPVHLLLFALFISVGFSSVSFALFLVSYFLIYQVSANMYHLYWSHRQFELEPVFERITSFLGLFVMTGDPLSYARTHRWHHAHADTDLDTHSPVHGRFHSMIGWLFKKSPVKGVLIPDLVTDEFKYLKFLSREKIKLIWLTLLAIGLISKEALLGVTLTMCLAFNLEMITNAFAHSPKTKSAKNVKFLAWMTFGVLHLGHHDNPGKLSKSDPGYLLIQSLRALRLVR